MRSLHQTPGVNRVGRWFGLHCMLAQLLVLAACVPARPQAPAKDPVTSWRATWVAAKLLTSPDLIDGMLFSAHQAGFNRVIVNVFYNGKALFNSALAPMYDKVSPGFDPLAYLVPKAHGYGIKVDAWFLVGRVGDANGSPILSAHPDWALQGPDGETIPWLNFVHPEARQFISDLMLETVDRYGVDGLHFDYTRFPEAKWGFDAYAAGLFSEKYGMDLDELRYADLPAYGVFEGNRLAQPSTARVLASFNDGSPALALNRYGLGEVILLNWDASERTVAADGEILRRSLRYLLRQGGQVYLFHSNPDPQGAFDRTSRWLQQLGWTCQEINDGSLSDLTVPSVVVLSNTYVISSAAAQVLAGFIQRGGRAIFIDGPTTSIALDAIQKITGMQSKSGYFSGYGLLVPNEDSPLVPVSQRLWSLERYQVADAKWRHLRMESINALIEGVYARVKQVRPSVLVSLTITSDQNQANIRYLQDWETWLQGRYVDVLVPRAYVDQPEQLAPILAAWQAPMNDYPGKIVIGLIAYYPGDPSNQAKPAAQLLEEVGRVWQTHSNGTSIFDLGHLTEEEILQLQASWVTAAPRP